MHKVGENSISLKEQEMIRRWSDQENCIASQNWLSRSPRFNLHINPCLQHNDAPKRMGQGPSFQGFFVCKHLAETASLWKDWDHTDTHDTISAPNTTQKKSQQFLFLIMFKKVYTHSLKRNTAKIHKSWCYLQNKLLRSFHGQSLGDLWRAFLDLLWRRALQFRGPSGCPLGWLMASCWAVSRPTIWV